MVFFYLYLYPDRWNMIFGNMKKSHGATYASNVCIKSRAMDISRLDLYPFKAQWIRATIKGDTMTLWHINTLLNSMFVINHVRAECWNNYGMVHCRREIVLLNRQLVTHPVNAVFWILQHDFHKDISKWHYFWNIPRIL